MTNSEQVLRRVFSSRASKWFIAIVTVAVTIVIANNPGNMSLIGWAGFVGMWLSAFVLITPEVFHD